MKYIVTVRLKLDVDHDPRRKKVGPCPVTGEFCSDVTGAHHSFLVEADGERAVTDKVEGDGFPHITRIEVVA